MTGNPPVVLVVEDDRTLADLYSDLPSDAREVRTAHDAEGALDALDGRVDVVLLDRRLPGRSGGEILREIRDREPDVRVAMVTAVEPDVDVVGMGFDDYPVKPVGFEELHATVERLLERASYTDRRREAFALATTMAVLEVRREPEELEASGEYVALKRRLTAVRGSSDAGIERIDAEDRNAVYRDVERRVASGSSGQR